MSEATKPCPYVTTNGTTSHCALAEAEVTELKTQLAEAQAALIETIEDATEGTEAAIRRAETAEARLADARRETKQERTRAVEWTREHNQRTDAAVGALEARLAEAQAQVAELRGNWKKYEPFVSRMEKAEAERDRLRAALEMVEWVYDASHGPNAECPWCRADESDGHGDNCARRAALNPPETHWKPEDGWKAGEALARWGKEGEE